MIITPMKISIRNIRRRGYWVYLSHQMHETSRFNNIFHRASRPQRAARFVFEQNKLLFFFESTITKPLPEAESPLSALNE